MFSFPIPNNLNGTQLLNELAEAGISAKTPLITDGLLWLEIKSTQKTKTAEIVANHNGSDTRPTIQEKLAEAGIDLDELRVALGL